MPGKVRVVIAVAALALCLTGLGAWWALRSLTASPPGAPEDRSGADNHDGPVAESDPSPPADPLARRFASHVRPFLERYCFACQGPKKQEAMLDLSRDATAAAVAANAGQWELVLHRLRAEEMPPENAPRRPGPDERAA